MPKYYRQADRQKRLRENERMWLQGMYFCDAFNVVLSNSFAKKGSKKLKYPDKPYSIFPKTKEEQEAERKQEQERITRNLEKLRLAWEASEAAKNI